MKRVIFTLCILLVGFGASLARAEFDTTGINPFATGVTSEDIEIEQDPVSPSAFTDVSFHLTSNATDLNRYKITWSVNGTVKKAGIGERNFVVKTGAFGEPIIVGITVALPSGPITKISRLSPQDATLLWEAIDSTVPPFYKGKKLPASEAVIKLVALPNFRGENEYSAQPDNSVFIWKRNGEIMQDVGGYGKDSVAIRHERLRSLETVGVKVSDLDNTSSAETSLTLSFYKPQTLFYSKNEVSGLWNIHPSNNFLLKGNALTVKAVPFFLSRGLASGDASFTTKWSMNNKEVALPNPDKPLSLTLQNPGISGTSAFEFNATNKNYPLQKATGSFNIGFVGK